MPLNRRSHRMALYKIQGRIFVHPFFFFFLDLLLSTCEDIAPFATNV